MEKKFEFKVLQGDKCAFVMKSDDIERTEVVTKQYAKEHYKDLIRQKGELMNQLSQANKQLEINKVEKNVELERFIEMANLANKYSVYMKAEENHKSIFNMIEGINDSMIKIEKALPEVKRMKK